MEPATNVSNKFALALGGAGIAAVGFGAMAVKAAMGAQVEMARFEATMKTIPGVTDEATKAILDRAQASTKLGFDDEESANVMAKLYQRTGDVNKAMELNALAMDLARSKGIELSAAGDAVGMVLSGNTKVLKQLGIEIDDTLTPMEMLAQAQEKLNGQAEGYSQTLQGQMDVLKIAGANLMETLGEKLIPLLVKFVQGLVPVIEKINEWVTTTEGIVKWLKEHETILIIVAGAIVGLLMPALISFAITITTVVIPAFIAMAIAAAPWLIGGAIIGAIVAGVVWIIKNWDMLAPKLKAVWEAIKGAFKDGVNFVIGLAEAWANSYVKAANIIIGALNKIQVSIPDWVPEIGGKSFGINIAKVPEVSLPRFEQGGFVPGARGTAVPIIAHGGEMVIPAGNARGASGGMSFVFQMNYPQFKSTEDVNVVRQQIESAMRDVVRVYKLQPS
jgi:hypothetical protein